MDVEDSTEASNFTPFERVSDRDLLKATLFNRCRLGDTGCWLWISYKDTGGYGQISLSGKGVKAHRVSYEVFVGPIPKGLHVLHSCDTPACVNPDHLKVGTQKDNALERESRGRRDVRGEQIGTSKLTAADVIAIRQSTLGQKALADKYGVAPSHIWVIRSGKAWKHLASQEIVDGR